MNQALTNLLKAEAKYLESAGWTKQTDVAFKWNKWLSKWLSPEKDEILFQGSAVQKQRMQDLGSCS